MGPNILNADQLTAWYNSKHRAVQRPGHQRSRPRVAVPRRGRRGERARRHRVRAVDRRDRILRIRRQHRQSRQLELRRDGRVRQLPLRHAVPEPADRRARRRSRTCATTRTSTRALPTCTTRSCRSGTARRLSVAAHNFDTFFRKGHAPTWNQMGNGNHATSPIYGSVVISTYMNMLSFSRPPARSRGRRRSGREPRGAPADARRRAHPGLDRRPVEEQPDRRRHLRERHRLRPHHRERTTGPTSPRRSPPPAPNHGFAATLPIRGGNGLCLRDQHRRREPGTRCSGAARCPGPNPIAIDRLDQPPAGRAPPARLDARSRFRRLRPSSTSTRTASAWPTSPRTAPARTSPRPTRATARPTASMPSCPASAATCASTPSTWAAGPEHVRSGAGASCPPTRSGAWTTATRTPYGIRVTGWALDADTTAADMVDIYANGVGVARIPAGQARNDVGRVYPAYGIFRGFDVHGPDRRRSGVRLRRERGAGWQRAARVPQRLIGADTDIALA